MKLKFCKFPPWLCHWWVTLSRQNPLLYSCQEEKQHYVDRCSSYFDSRGQSLGTFTQLLSNWCPMRASMCSLHLNIALASLKSHGLSHTSSTSFANRAACRYFWWKQSNHRWVKHCPHILIMCTWHAPTSFSLRQQTRLTRCSSSGPPQC